MLEVVQRVARVAGTLVLTSVWGCGDTSVSGPPDATPDRTNRTLPEGTYEVTFTACRACEPGSVPDYLLVLGRGLEGRVEIAGAGQSGATLRLIEMQDAGSELGDVLGFFADVTIPLAWSEADAAFRGAVSYGAASVFEPIFRRSGESLECDFEVFHLKHDVGATTCTADQ